MDFEKFGIREKWCKVLSLRGDISATRRAFSIILSVFQCSFDRLRRWLHLFCAALVSIGTAPTSLQKPLQNVGSYIFSGSASVCNLMNFKHRVLRVPVSQTQFMLFQGRLRPFWLDEISISRHARRISI